MFKNALKELLLVLKRFRESAEGAKPIRKYKFKSHSRAELLKIIVSGYGLPRYLGRKLVRALLSDRFKAVIRVVPRN